MLAEGDPDAISGTSLHNSATSIPQLHYPELACPALEPNLMMNSRRKNLWRTCLATFLKRSENDLFGTFNDEEPINLRADDSPTERNGTNGIQCRVTRFILKRPTKVKTIWKSRNLIRFSMSNQLIRRLEDNTPRRCRARRELFI